MGTTWTDCGRRIKKYLILYHCMVASASLPYDKHSHNWWNFLSSYVFSIYRGGSPKIHVPSAVPVTFYPNNPIYTAVPSVLFADIFILTAKTTTTTTETTAFPILLYHPTSSIDTYGPNYSDQQPLMLRFYESGRPPGFSGTPYHWTMYTKSVTGVVYLCHHFCYPESAANESRILSRSFLSMSVGCCIRSKLWLSPLETMGTPNPTLPPSVSSYSDVLVKTR